MIHYKKSVTSRELLCSLYGHTKKYHQLHGHRMYTRESYMLRHFVFKGTVIPQALPNRLISACLSMWTLKQYEGRKLLFSGFIVVSFDKAHDILVCVEGNKILLYMVHKTSAGLIVPDIATGVKECLQDDALNQIPSDVELHRFSSGCDESTIQKLAIHLGMTIKEWEKLVTDYRWIDIVMYRILAGKILRQIQQPSKSFNRYGCFDSFTVSGNLF
ncbi:unnamed protein product [Mytilus coruscus]|uniref:Uncharacterized protein n=1 Tax=Mytilus coruscus TaxID=42192 RepID=A0A6J8AB95_MYTCO|nr:unnamed protein product [Mytilus coruscus]